MVVDADGVFVSQRRFPKLCLVAPSLPAEAPGALRLEAPGMPPIDAPVVDDGPRIACRVWGDGVEGVDQGATAGKWVSKFLRCRGCRLVRMPDGATRQVDRTYAPKRTSTAFSDGCVSLLFSCVRTRVVPGSRCSSRRRSRSRTSTRG